MLLVGWSDGHAADVSWLNGWAVRSDFPVGTEAGFGLCRTVGHDQNCNRLTNSLDSKGNYSATSNNTKLVHSPLMGGLLHLVQRGGDWAGCGSLYHGPLLCGFNVVIKGLTARCPG